MNKLSVSCDKKLRRDFDAFSVETITKESEKYRFPKSKSLNLTSARACGISCQELFSGNFLRFFSINWRVVSLNVVSFKQGSLCICDR